MRRGNAKPCRAARSERPPAPKSARAELARVQREAQYTKNRRESELSRRCRHESRLSAEKAGLVSFAVVKAKLSLRLLLAPRLRVPRGSLAGRVVDQAAQR